jgi:2-polyprenyl-3-methyl-5-hydroxy-6-metoxy-1,4-benzoquinol methylase
MENAAMSNQRTSDNSQNNASEYWSSVYAEGTHFGKETYWLAIPEIRDRYQRKATGNQAAHWVAYVVKHFLETNTAIEAVLSVGCGTGQLERNLAQLGITGKIEGIDISATAIALAREAAGAPNISYRLESIETLRLPTSYYDAIFFNSSFHHLTDIEQVCEKVRQSLKPDGYLILNEYVGASRFDFPERQKQAMRAAFDLIPAAYRRSFNPNDFGRVRQTMGFPDPAQVAAVDPTEAVRSAEIVELIHRYFEVVVHNPCGGTLLQYVLNGIAGNFIENDARAKRILQMLCDIEDGLIESGDLSSDFVLIVARPKT